MRTPVSLSLAAVLVLSACAEKPLHVPLPSGSGAVQVQELLAKANVGDNDSAFKLGAIYHDGKGVPQDFAVARTYFTQAAEAGDRRAEFNLGLMYLQAEGGSEDLEKARSWFTKAADHGNARSMYQLGLLAYQGKGEKQNYKRAFTLFQQAALSGISDAQYNLAILYIRGEGIEDQDYAEGYAWLKIAEKNGYPTAASTLQKLKSKLPAEMQKDGDARMVKLEESMKKIEQQQ